MRLFVQSLNGEGRKWFKGLPNGSINDWDELERQFIQRWGEKRDHEYVLKEFNAISKKPKEDILELIKISNKQYNNAISKKPKEDISELIKIFNKQYNNPFIEIKPPQVAAPIVFA